MRILKTYHIEDVIFIYYQILVTYLQGYVKLLERKINDQIFGVKGLNKRLDWRAFPNSHLWGSGWQIKLTNF